MNWFDILAIWGFLLGIGNLILHFQVLKVLKLMEKVLRWNSKDINKLNKKLLK